MEQLETFFKICFGDIRIIDNRIDDFTTDHLAKLEANNETHEYDTMITDTTAALTEFRLKKTDKSETLADRKAATITVDQYEENFIELVRRASGTVLAQFPKSSPVYAEFFPIPLGDYTNPLRPMIGGYIDHFITRFTAHAAEFGIAMRDAFISLKASYDPARSAQEAEAAEVKSLIAETSVERDALDAQLFSNLLKLADKYKGQPEYAKVFFDTSTLFFHAHDMFIPGVVHPISFKALQTKNSNIEGLVGSTLRLINSGLTRLQFFTESSPQNPVPGEISLTVEPGGDVTTTMADISGSETHKYLFIKNLDAAAGDGSVEITGTVKPV